MKTRIVEINCTYPLRKPSVQNDVGCGDTNKNWMCSLNLINLINNIKCGWWDISKLAKKTICIHPNTPFQHMLFPATIFCAHVKGSFKPRSNSCISSVQPLQQAENGLKSTKNTAHRMPIGHPNMMRMMNQIILQSQPQFAISLLYWWIRSLMKY